VKHQQHQLKQNSMV